MLYLYPLSTVQLEVNQFLGLSRFSCSQLLTEPLLRVGGWCLYQDIVQRVVDLLVSLNQAD